MAGPKYDLHYNFCVLINLMYFVCDICLAVCNNFLSSVISFYFLRFYFIILCFCYVCILSPATKRCIKLYKSFGISIVSI